MRLTARSSPQATGFCLAALGAVLFSTKSVLIKLAYAYPVTPVTLLALRMACAAPFYLIAAKLAGRNGSTLRNRDLLQLFLFGLIGYYGASFLDFAGLAYISASLEWLLLYTYPAIVLFIAAFASGRPVSRRDLLAAALTYAGVGCVFVNGGQSGGASRWPGVILVLASAFAYAVYLVGSQRIIPRLGALRYTSLAMLPAVGGTMLHFAFSGAFADLAHLPAPVYAYGLALGLFATVLPTFMISAGIARIGAAKAAMIGALGPVATLLLAWIFLGEEITAVQIAGTVLIIVGIHAASRGDRPKV